jgi:hypothetical protein
MKQTCSKILKRKAVFNPEFKVMRIGGQWQVIRTMIGGKYEITHWWTFDINRP